LGVGGSGKRAAMNVFEILGIVIFCAAVIVAVLLFLRDLEKKNRG
jgi:hypothetical protein